jgi:hypothetical protein
VGVVVRFDLNVCASACVAVRAAVRTVAGAPFLPLPSVRVRMDYVHARVVRYCDSRFFGALVGLLFELTLSQLELPKPPLERIDFGRHAITFHR